MTIKNGKVTFTSGNSENYYSQRNNMLVWPDKIKWPSSQISVSWKTMCNVTSICEALEIAGWNFPVGQYKQPEDNLGKYILESKEIDDLYKKCFPAMYKSYIRALSGQASSQELKSVTPPIEIHDLLSKGTNLWIGSTATNFYTNLNFKKALWSNMVESNLPMVISTTFGGFGHIVVCTGFTMTEAEYNKAKTYRKENPKELPDEFEVESIKVDDPWGNCSKSKFESYPAGGGGSGYNIDVPWNIVIDKVKPANSRTVKWAHIFKHGVATI